MCPAMPTRNQRTSDGGGGDSSVPVEGDSSTSRPAPAAAASSSVGVDEEKKFAVTFTSSQHAAAVAAESGPDGGSTYDLSRVWMRMQRYVLIFFLVNLIVLAVCTALHMCALQVTTAAET
jgi:hypothetical protein